MGDEPEDQIVTRARRIHGYLFPDAPETTLRVSFDVWLRPGREPLFSTTIYRVDEYGNVIQ